MKILARTVATLLLFSTPALAQTNLTVANWLPPAHPLVSEVIVPMAESIGEVTEGSVTATLLPAPLGPPQAHFDFAVNGVADITFGVQGYNPGRFKTTNLAELPFLSDSAEALSVAYWRTFEAMLQGAGEYDDVKVLAVFTHGPGEVFLGSGDAASPDLMTGTKLRVGGGIAHDVATALGAVPVEGPSSKAYELLSQGVADGILFPPESVSFFNLIPELPVGVSVPGGLYNTSFYIVMNKAKWDSLSPEDQTAIDSVTGEALARLAGQMWDRADAQGLEAMAGQTAVTPATQEQLTAWSAALQPVIDAKLAEVGETGVDAMVAFEMLQAEVANAGLSQ